MKVIQTLDTVRQMVCLPFREMEHYHLVDMFALGVSFSLIDMYIIMRHEEW